MPSPLIVCRELWIAQYNGGTDEGGWIIGGIFSSRQKAEDYGREHWPEGGWQVSRWWLNDKRFPYSHEYVPLTRERGET